MSLAHSMCKGNSLVALLQSYKCLTPVDSEVSYNALSLLLLLNMEPNAQHARNLAKELN